ncbi:MAG: transposase [Chloroflexota bacterium]|nr:transposase [Chloroflexota bacterium]
MKLTAKVKLQPNEVQADSLKRTLEKANAACDYISQVAWDTRTFGQFKIHHFVYNNVRAVFDLTAQMVVRCISKVTDAYKLDRKTKRTFKPLGSIAYDIRILSWKMDKNEVSIWTVDGRQKMSFVAGQHHKGMLVHQRGESDLCLIDGVFYLFTTCDIDEPTPKDVEDFLGVDMGVANIAVDSDGVIHQGKTVKQVHYRYRQLRRKLQAKGTHATRRLLKKRSKKEQRFATWTNHNISKIIVATAKDTNRGIAIEELGGIRDRVTVRRSQRAALSSWSFAQLRTFIEYKAKQAGVLVVAVDPHNTSRTCPCCGHIDKANRKSQSKFLCVDCGFSGLADYIAAGNIRSRAVVNRSYISDAILVPSDSSARDKAHPL